jgi:hypothetical protein
MMQRAAIMHCLERVTSELDPRFYSFSYLLDFHGKRYQGYQL